MRLFGKDLDRQPVLIAEIGVNHEGDPDAALRMVALAAQAGADAVKFQSYTPERFISADDPERQARVRRFGLDRRAHERLKAAADREGVAFFSSAISEDWVAPLVEIGADAIKIASGDIDFEPVISAAARTDLPVLMSTGTATVAEVDRAVAWFRADCSTEDASHRLVLMHCVSAYPTPMEEANLNAIPAMAEKYHPVTIGYSNHVIGPHAPLAAVALGARVIEVHFTDRKVGRDFRDHALSADADDLKFLAEMIPKVAAARGDGVKSPQECERDAIWAIRKGVVAARDLQAGDVLDREAIQFARPATEIPASKVDTVLGRRLRQAVARGATVPRAAID